MKLRNKINRLCSVFVKHFVSHDVGSTPTSKYLLFTGLPGGGKSFLHKKLQHVLELEGNTVVFRDDVIRTYSTYQLYWYAVSKISFAQLLSVASFWLQYPVQVPWLDIRARRRVWNKKMTLIKRMILAHVILAVEKPDYFIDESIEAQYRFVDVEYEEKTSSQWSLYPQSQIHVIVVHTPIEIAAERHVKREVHDIAAQGAALKSRLEQREWFETMEHAISILTGMLHRIPNAQLVSLDGTEDISKNVEYLRQHLRAEHVPHYDI